MDLDNLCGFYKLEHTIYRNENNILKGHKRISYIKLSNISIITSYNRYEGYGNELLYDITVDGEKFTGIRDYTMMEIYDALKPYIRDNKIKEILS